MSPLFSDLLRLKNVPGARVCQEITLDTMLGAAGEDFKGSYGPDGLRFPKSLHLPLQALASLEEYH